MGGFTKLFRTHPPTEERIAALRQPAGLTGWGGIKLVVGAHGSTI
jgi:hypothetical protein